MKFKHWLSIAFTVNTPKKMQFSCGKHFYMVQKSTRHWKLTMWLNDTNLTFFLHSKCDFQSIYFLLLSNSKWKKSSKNVNEYFIATYLVWMVFKMLLWVWILFRFLCVWWLRFLCVTLEHHLRYIWFWYCVFWKQKLSIYQ